MNVFFLPYNVLKLFYSFNDFGSAWVVFPLSKYSKEGHGLNVSDLNQGGF